MTPVCRYIDHQYLCEKEELEEQIAALQTTNEELRELLKGMREAIQTFMDSSGYEEDYVRLGRALSSIPHTWYDAETKHRRWQEGEE